jgi:ATP-dependent helicase/nuclease subunit A
MTNAEFAHVTFISAGAGSGKTYRLTEELERALVEGTRPSGVIGTTFTVKAAGELNDRVRERLIGSGRIQLAQQMSQALIGTVHSVCERLLKRFAFELGLSPELNVLGIEDHRLFHQALDEVTDLDTVRTMNALAARLETGRWQEHVEKIAQRARDNDIDGDALRAMGTDSARALLEFFPRIRQGDHCAALLQAVDSARAMIDPVFDPTKTTREYLDRLQTASNALRGEDCPWSVWVSLSTKSAAKKSEAEAARVRAAAALYEVHPDFHADVYGYVEGIYAIAAKTLGRSQALKTERGLIDFSDMEQLTLRAVDNPHVRECLEDELDLLLVDEFQDTDPMQLALFVKLARLAKRVIFVGDVKQSIYAFRGCDPELVDATLKDLKRRGAKTDVLQSSWRARPQLLGYLNELFVDAFAADGIDAGAIALRAQRKNLVDTPAVLQWRSAGDQAAQYDALSRGIAKLVADATPIVDPETKLARALRFGDVAVLARTTDHVEEIALALKAARVPMKMSLAGLLAVPEVCFAKACLRRLADRADTLATAEIAAFADCGDPERWLADRLRHLTREARADEWLDDSHPIVKRLAEFRGAVAFQSPVETVARVLNDIGIREVIAGWGRDAVKAAQRQRNLDAFLNLAVEYENYCESQHEAATLTGFLFWVQNPHSPELDLQPTVTTGDAVHVLTYHKAKGLEWPVVVTTDFDYVSRSALWDVRVRLTAPFDVDAPLAHRTIRFWPNVFGPRSKDIAPLAAILGSDEAQVAERSSQAEQRRLAYVGTTRARDLLIVALPAKDVRADAWLNTFATAQSLPTGNAFQLRNGDVINTGFADPSNAAAVSEARPYAPVWFVERPRVAAPLPATLSPSRAAAVDGAAIAEVVDLGERVVVRSDDMALIGRALHAVIAAELVNGDRADAALRARSILRGCGAEHFVDPDAAVMCARRLRVFIAQRLKPLRILAEYPATQTLENGQAVRGWIDVLVETADGWVVIDHKSSPRPKSEWRVEALEHSGQIASYRAMIAASGARLAPSAWIHFPVSGGMIRIDAGANEK